MGASHSFADVPHGAGTTAQRVRIGLTGLAFAFLLVLLGSIVSRSGRDDTSPPPESATQNEPQEPLAELGVAPGSEKPEKAENASSESP